MTALCLDNVMQTVEKVRESPQKVLMKFPSVTWLQMNCKILLNSLLFTSCFKSMCIIFYFLNITH